MKGIPVASLPVIVFSIFGLAHAGPVEDLPRAARVGPEIHEVLETLGQSEPIQEDAIFDSATSTLYVPCVSVIDGFYRAELVISADAPYHLTVTQVEAVDSAADDRDCTQFDFSENALRLSRVRFDSGVEVWADLLLVRSNPLVFAIKRAGILGGDGNLQCGAMGDSIGAATHANDACDPKIGEHREFMDCLELRLGSHDPNWSYMGGSKSWSLASRLGCGYAYNTSKDGEEWKDALDQASKQAEEGHPETVILNLGSNDVCARFGHDYGNQAFVEPTTEGHIVSLEAEHFIERFPGTSHQWEPVVTPGASIQALGVKPISGAGSPGNLDSNPQVDYRIHFSSTGPHYIWVRGYSEQSGGRLIHLWLDEQSPQLSQDIGTAGDRKWVWSGLTDSSVRAVVVVPSVGPHTLHVRMADEGVRLDKIVLTTWSDWAPSGVGPPESGRGILKAEDLSGYGLVAMEAEHYHHLEKQGISTWEPGHQPGYSGGASMRATPEIGASFDPGSGPRLDYNVHFTVPGTYFVWIRGLAADGNADSIQVGVDGIVDRTRGMIHLPVRNTWSWSNGPREIGQAATIDIPSSGIHTLSLWMVEDGFIVDKLVLTRDGAYEPSGSGPQETWENDLGRIAGHMDDTMIYLTEHLSPYGQIYWSGIVDIVAFRDMMVDRTHDHAFETCQDLWDLDIRAGSLQGDAKNSLCKGELGDFCDWLPNQVQDEFLNRYLDAFQNDFKDDTPCGRVLDSRNTQEEREEARRFNKSLNDLMEQKAAQYHNRKAVSIHFTQKPWYSTDQFRPYFVSRLDCYHPNRLGQMKLAQMVWEGYNPDFTPTDSFYHDGFDDEEWCTQEFTNWDSCWYDGGWGECGDEFICENDAGGWFKFGKETSNNEDHWIARDVGDLSGASEVWVYFKHKRDQFDGDRLDWVGFFVWDGLSWVEVDRFERHNDEGNHCSQYYDLTPYRNAVPFRIKFQTNNSSDMKNGDKLMLDEISVFGW